jgi:hypothetical protein
MLSRITKETCCCAPYPPSEPALSPALFFTFFFYSLYLFRMKRKRGCFANKKKQNTASLAPLSFTPSPPSVPAPPAKQPPSLSHIFTYGDWGRGEGCYAGGGKGLKNGPLKALVLLLLFLSESDPLPFQNEKEEGCFAGE